MSRSHIARGQDAGEKVPGEKPRSAEDNARWRKRRRARNTKPPTACEIEAAAEARAERPHQQQ